MPLVILALMLGVVVAPAEAATKHIRYYYDAAVIDHELQARKGMVEVQLPPDIRPNSLRIKPFPGVHISGVTTSPAGAGLHHRANDRLREKRDALTARLKAIEAREEIFKAAARSQSGKAPRKTKTNPDPVSVIKQGTEHALNQLEEAFRLRSKTEEELREVEAKLKGEQREGAMARVKVSPADGKIILSYVVPRLHWTPSYEFRLSGNERVVVKQKAVLPPGEPSARHSVVAASLASSSQAAGSVPAGKERVVAGFDFPAKHEEENATGLPTVTFSFRNESPSLLPAGEAACYRNGNFYGMGSFPGAAPGETIDILCGK